MAKIYAVTNTYRRYEKYERVDMGDFNWITPHFLAFASPQQKPVASIPRSSPEFLSLPRTIQAVENSIIPEPFKNVLCHFKERNIGLVVRLNSELYSPSYFTALGIEHIDMIFDDGTCPPLPLVKKFIKLAHEIINTQKKSIAVHCKAGLGRTGCLIGAYLIYRYGFTANDLIAFMRFMRPGMVVGPQQHWLHINQGSFRQWYWEDSYKEKLALLMPVTPTKSSRHRIAGVQTATPPQGNQGSKRTALEEITHNEASGQSQPTDDYLPAPTPGQPRKTSRMNSPARQGARAQSASFGIIEDDEQPEKEVVEMHTHRRSQGQAEGESEEEWQLRRLSRRTSSRSPADKKRAISYTTTTTTTTYNLGDNPPADGVMSDVENWGQDVQMGEKAPKSRTPSSAKSGNGSGTIGMVKVRNSPLRRSAEGREVKSGVRKTSGRVGSMGAAATAMARVK